MQGKYCLCSQKWTKIENISEFSFPMYDFEAVLTSNEKYIVLLGGTRGDDSAAEDIFVLDMEDNN